MTERKATGRWPRARHSARIRNRRLRLEGLETRIALSGTPQLVDLNPLGASSPAEFTQVGGISFFAADDGTSGRELWVTNGTAAGTALLKDIFPGSDSSNPSHLVNVNGTLFFIADDGSNGEELWKSNGTAAGTVMVRDINAGEGYQYPYGDGPLQSFPRELTAVGGQLFFSAEDQTVGGELWRSNGTESGTVLVKDIASGTYTDDYGTYPWSSNPRELAEVNGLLYFSAFEESTGRELWKSDGTSAGTTLVKDIFPGTHTDNEGSYANTSQPMQLTNVDGTLFFFAQDEDHGAELWKSNGTASGTVLVKDIAPGTADSVTTTSRLVALDGVVLFAANDGVNGNQLWRSDGTASGTVLVKEIVMGGSAIRLSDYAGLTRVGELVYFAAGITLTGAELWKSDGTDENTLTVRDINPGTVSSNPYYMADINGTLYFSAATEATGRELWRSDGTAAGTVMVADSVPGEVGLNPKSISSVNGTVLFSGDNGSGRELWLLATDAAVAQAQLTVVVASEQVVIPANIGVDAGGDTAAVFTTDTTGLLTMDPATSVTLGDFFDVWRTDAGLAGNNPNAVFHSDELLGNSTDTTNTLQMFVNGALSTAYDDYVLRSGDSIVLVFGANPVVSLNTNFGPIVLELFEEETPGTVDNFLNYVNDGDYINSFFHRSDPDFVIQGGGFSTPSTTFTNTTQFSSVPTDPAIENEPGISNVRGTVAMAKLGGNPDSATSQFFVNLSDTNAFLDLPAYNSFTVFAQVLDMATVDVIEALPINTSNASPFRELPVSSDGQLAVIQSIVGNGRLTGIKFLDSNANGVRDSGEATLAGVPVFIDANKNGLLDAADLATTTDADGRYLLQVEPGEYTLRAGRSAGHIGTVPATRDNYSVTVTMGRAVADLDFGEVLLVAPTSVDLLSTADSGVAADDNITNLNNSTGARALTFQVNGVRDGATVRVYSDGILIGSATAAGSTATVSTDGVTLLSDTTHNMTATQALGGTESGASSALVVTIDTVPPAAIGSAALDPAQAGQSYTFDVNSAEEGPSGVSYSLAGAPVGMTIAAGTGVISWTPSAAQAVPQTFTILVTDTAGNSNPRTVELTVLGMIAAFPDEYTLAEDSVLAVDAETGVLANDGDSASGVLAAVLIANTTSGSVSLNADGSFTYTPNDDFFGTDSFTYRASDQGNDSNVARVTLVVTPVNDPVIGVSDAYSTTEDLTLTIAASAGLLANDLDADGDTLVATLASQAGNGLVTVNTNGSFSYVPNTNFVGTDSFTYTVSDGVVTAGPVFVSLTVTAVNDPPTAAADSYTVDEDGTLTVGSELGVLANDSDPDSTLTAVVNTLPGHGDLVLDSAGSFTYTPDDDFFGTDSFTYRASDGTSQSAATTVTITVNGRPDPPTAADDSATAGNDGSAQTINVLSNDTSDPDAAQTLSIVSVTQGTAGGTVAISGTTVAYTAPLGFVGADSFTYSIRDTDNLTDTATVTVSVTEAANSSLSGYVFVDTNGNGAFNADEVGVPGARITLTGVENGGDSVHRSLMTTNAGFYLFAELAAGTYELTQTQPEALVDGLDSTSVTGAVVGNDQITNLVVSGGQDFSGNNFGESHLKPAFVSIVWFFASSTAPDALFRELVATAEEKAGHMELSLAIRNETTDGVNTPPVAFADAYSVDGGGSLTVTAATGLLANDTDADDDSLTAALVDAPANGSLTLNENGSFTYTPPTGFSGTASFTYRASDGVSASNLATVTIAVGGELDTFTINENSPAKTFVGTVVPDTSLGTPVVFEFDDPSHPDALNLLPDDHMAGDTAAAIVLIEYLDLQCPTCRQLHTILQDVEDEFAGDLLVVRRHLPLTDGHANAFAAARAAEAAARQGAFDEMVGLLFENQSEWKSEDDPQSFFESYADVLDLDVDEFIDDLADATIDDRIERDIASANSLGITTTPSLYANGRALDLDDVLDDFEDVLEDELADFDEPFVIDRATGDIFVSGSVGLNFESTPTHSLNVTVTNRDAVTMTIPVTIHLTDVNESAPVAVADAYSVDENGQLTIVAAAGVLVNDSDADGDALTAHLVSAPANGTLTLNANGSFTYVPTAGFSGNTSFTYQVSDGLFTSNTATVTLTVIGANNPPVATADSYEASAGEVLTIGASLGVLSNDTDVDGGPLPSLQIGRHSSPAHGSLTVQSDGSFTYQPDEGFVGTDTFTYRASDGQKESDEATVTITVGSAGAAAAAAVGASTAGGMDSDPFASAVDQVLTDEEGWLAF